MICRAERDIERERQRHRGRTEIERETTETTTFWYSLTNARQRQKKKKQIRKGQAREGREMEELWRRESKVRARKINDPMKRMGQRWKREMQRKKVWERERAERVWQRFERKDEKAGCRKEVTERCSLEMRRIHSGRWSVCSVAAVAYEIKESDNTEQWDWMIGASDCFKDIGPGGHFFAFFI